MSLEALLIPDNLTDSVSDGILFSVFNFIPVSGPQPNHNRGLKFSMNLLPVNVHLGIRFFIQHIV